MSDHDDEPGGWIYLVYLWTLAPWAFMQVFDAVDSKKRHVEGLPWRLGLSLFFNFTSTAVGVWYVVWSATRATTESATMLIGVLLNSWYWKRNLRGWRSYRVLLSQRQRVCKLVSRFMNIRMQGMLAKYGGNLEDGIVPTSGTAADWNRKWDFFWVNDAVIDNDPREDHVSLASGSWHAKIGGDVLWRMVWLQGTIGKPQKDRGIAPDNEHKQAAEYAPGNPPCHGEKMIIREEALDHVIREVIGDLDAKAVSVPQLRAELAKLSQEDQARLTSRAAEDCQARLAAWEEQTREQRIESLTHYDVGQQDIGGLPPAVDSHPASIDSLWCAMSWVFPDWEDTEEIQLVLVRDDADCSATWCPLPPGTWHYRVPLVTGSAPPPMENIWYESAALADHLERFATDEARGQVAQAQWPTFPRLSQWYRIAGDLARLRDVPLLLSVREGRRYALQLASVSALLAYYYSDYKALCVKVHRLGIKARWTHGWSGLVSCYSMYWTLGNVSVALLGGLPLLAIVGGGNDHDSVACLLVGLASENIMSTYLSDARRAARTKELARRYYLDKGKTCRGSGVGCIREALEALGLPRSASQLDGVIAFSAGWAMEAVHGLPGSQQPRDGQTHGQIEDIYCSSRAYRFPDERL